MQKSFRQLRMERRKHHLIYYGTPEGKVSGRVIASGVRLPSDKRLAEMVGFEKAFIIGVYPLTISDAYSIINTPNNEKES